MNRLAGADSHVMTPSTGSGGGGGCGGGRLFGDRMQKIGSWRSKHGGKDWPGSLEVHWRTAASQGGVPVGQQQQQQQRNRLRLAERSPVTVSSYPCCSAAAFVVATMALLCWHVIPSRSLFLTFSSSTGDDVPAGSTATRAAASSVSQMLCAL